MSSPRIILTRSLRLSYPITSIPRATAVTRQPIYRSDVKMTRKTMTSDTISKITQKEKKLTGQDNPVEGGPTAQAQKHAGEPVSSNVISDITQGEKKVTGEARPIKGGPAALAQSIGAAVSSGQHPTGTLDSSTISHITAAEKELTGEEGPIKGGPTSVAQKHAGQHINSQILHDITEAEKHITSGERVKGGPTATAQSELAKSQT